MINIKSLVKRKFKSEYFPVNVYFDASSICEKTKNIELLGDEEIIVIIDNEPDTKIIDYSMLTDKRIIIVKDDIIRFVNYYDIENFELPDEKMNNDKQYEDPKMNRSDKAKIHLINGDIEEIRIIYGGIYLLASVLKNPAIKKGWIKVHSV